MASSSASVSGLFLSSMSFCQLNRIRNEGTYNGKFGVVGGYMPCFAVVNPEFKILMDLLVLLVTIC
jgi:hypothetical protein